MFLTPKNDAFQLSCSTVVRRLLRVPWTARRSNQSILKKSVLNIHWKDWCWSWNSNALATWCKEPTHWKRPFAGKDWRWEEAGTTEDELVGWHHRLDGHEFEQALGADDGQGSLVCCSPWSHKESDMTEWLNWTELRSLVNETCLRASVVAHLRSQNGLRPKRASLMSSKPCLILFLQRLPTLLSCVFWLDTHQDMNPVLR